MSCISFSDLGMICRHFNLNTGEVFELLSSPARAVITRSAGMPKRSVTAVSDSASEASSVVSTEYKFASAKTADFAKEMCSKHDISMDSITATGNGGKITKEDIKKVWWFSGFDTPQEFAKAKEEITFAEAVELAKQEKTAMGKKPEETQTSSERAWTREGLVREYIRSTLLEAWHS